MALRERQVRHVRYDRRMHIGGGQEQRGRQDVDGDGLSSFSTSSGDVNGSCINVGPEWRQRRLAGSVVDASLAAID